MQRGHVPLHLVEVHVRGPSEHECQPRITNDVAGDVEERTRNVEPLRVCFAEQSHGRAESSLIPRDSERRVVVPTAEAAHAVCVVANSQRVTAWQERLDVHALDVRQATKKLPAEAHRSLPCVSVLCVRDVQQPASAATSFGGERAADHGPLPWNLPRGPLDVPWVVVEFLAGQLGIADASVVKSYGSRLPTRHEHAREIAGWSATGTSRQPRRS